MTDVRLRFLEPIDVLALRGNRPFGDPGSYGVSVLPPWPSVAAGALRSLVFAETGKAIEDADEFRILDFHIARRLADGSVQRFHSLPSDLNAIPGQDATPLLRRLLPRTPAQGLLCSAPLAKLPVVAEDARGKPTLGYWLDDTGWTAHLSGTIPAAESLRSREKLWELDERVGVGLDATSGRADDGKLFSMQTVAFARDVGFLVAFAGSVEIPEQGIARIGGDGHAVRIHAIASGSFPRSDYASIAASGRARVVLTSPGIFPDGWRLPGMRDDGRLELHGVRARVVAAAVPRAEVVSGWDLARWQPKPAQRVAPRGSVYWLEDLEASSELLDKLADHGLWAETGDHESRRVEGYNRFAFGASPE